MAKRGRLSRGDGRVKSRLDRSVSKPVDRKAWHCRVRVPAPLGNRVSGHVRQIFAVKVARGGGIAKQVFSARQRAIRMNSVVNVFQLSKCTRRCAASRHAESAWEIGSASASAFALVARTLLRAACPSERPRQRCLNRREPRRTSRTHVASSCFLPTDGKAVKLPHSPRKNIATILARASLSMGGVAVTHRGITGKPVPIYIRRENARIAEFSGNDATLSDLPRESNE